MGHSLISMSIPICPTDLPCSFFVVVFFFDSCGFVCEKTVWLHGSFDNLLAGVYTTVPSCSCVF